VYEFDMTKFIFCLFALLIDRMRRDNATPVMLLIDKFHHQIFLCCLLSINKRTTSVV